ncbi:MAG TPA: glutaminyl-peptide cyclotransferase [Pyrinomonadaceae bacterium]
MTLTPARILSLLLAPTLLLLCVGCQQQAARDTGASNSGARSGATSNSMSNDGTTRQLPVYGYEVVNSWPHDREAFTQGLVFHEGALIESTGQYGESSLRRVELQTGRVLQKTDVPPQFFAEGATLLRGKLYQLTWTTERGFVYDPATLKKTGEFRYSGEGWGLTHDGESLILSDGTNQIRFLNPDTFAVSRTINVFDRGRPVREINELEYVKGEIYANVWKTDRVARIDPQTGALKGWIDLKGIISTAERSGDTDAVLNGIAYDERGDRLFVTGKLWPKLFEIRLKEGR